ncbi:bifunctional 3-(3-hydroxy-phenyl)propionate/3-hydroxycinnamic acid hydroxylase [Actinomadura sp. 1N219]|uniref:bifunctional 3-(3-hydroxy-phenyl)propionate/3-hydroxycinnamic acid hydroxylase n=1 Tax=Actinomadura sp. 1N219 TaxID=3375152 RepID=UPI003794B4A1
MTEVDVAIVGAGPVGLTIANYLGMYGVETLVLERGHGIVEYPRAIGMDDEALRAFQGIGLAGPLLADMIQNVPLRFFDGTGRCFADILPGTREFGWYRRNIFMQPLAERTLRDGLERFPNVTLLPGHDVVRLRQDGDGVDLDVLTDDGGHHVVRAKYVVGADGGRSTVRELSGIVLEGDTHPRKWVVIECDNDPVDAPFTGLHCDPARPYVCAHLPFDYRRWEFMLFPGEDGDTMLAPENVRKLLARHVPDPDSVNVIRARVYTHHSRVAQRFVSGRVCLAGDAAHLMPPWAGQGMNTGIRDAVNVSWKLAAAVQGRAAPSILDTYDTERRAHARAMVNLSTTLGRVLSPTDRRVAFLRDAFFRAANWTPGVKEWVLQMRFKPMPRYRDGIVVPSAPAVGRMFVQPDVETLDGATVPLDDVLGKGFAVLGFETDPAEHLDDGHRTFLHGLGTTFLKVVESRPGSSHHHAAPDTVVIEDRDNGLRQWFDGRPERLVVLRPDRYVAALTGPTGLNGAVDALRERLGAAATV